MEVKLRPLVGGYFDSLVQALLEPAQESWRKVIVSAHTLAVVNNNQLFYSLRVPVQVEVSENCESSADSGLTTSLGTCAWQEKLSEIQQVTNSSQQRSPNRRHCQGINRCRLMWEAV